MKPEVLWWWSCRLHERGLTPLAKVLKALNFLLFKAVLPYQCKIQRDVVLFHRGMGTVIHPKSTIGRGVRIAQHVTLSVSDQSWSAPDRVVIGDDVLIGAGAFLSAKGRELHIGDGARIGVNTFVRNDVPAGHVVRGPRSTVSPPSTAAVLPADPAADAVGG